MKIGITGASGFIGQRLVQTANRRGHRVIGFSRNVTPAIPGCTETRLFDLNHPVNISGCDALVHLAGESVAGIWSRAKKKRILESRQLGTRHLVDAILAAQTPPAVFASGSAIGFYGNTGENPANEGAAAGEGFLAEVTKAWEQEAMRASEANIRIILLRTGMVLGNNGGALQAMLPAFRAGLGGRFGSGKQWMSWVHLDDAAALALFAIENQAVQGPLNVVAPNPARNAEFTQILAHSLHRPAFFNVPAFALKMMLRGFSSELLDSKRIIPAQALRTGFEFQFPVLKTALDNLFKP